MKPAVKLDFDAVPKGIGRPPRPTSERFWEKVKKGKGCWEWQGEPTRGGYGVLRIAGRNVPAHRVGYALQVGPVGALCVCHRCDNKLCVRGAHLFLGTHADNVHDCITKGRRRNVNGEAHGSAKLTAQEVKSIRVSAAQGISQRSLAAQFSVAESVVSRIVHRVLWGSV